MIKIKKGDEVYDIDCDNAMCMRCSFQPVDSGLKCKMFDILLDHLVSNSKSNYGNRRLPECKKAEVYE